ncbi:hypothetical protein FACS1894105_05690 [Clostridia bacterium]|nr:hypothetical protein FACS1894105_05690 [Clostridia bacterium]
MKTERKINGTGKISHEQFLNVITYVYIILLVASNVMAMKVVSIFGVTMDAGSITYPVTFMIGDLFADHLLCC